MMGTLRRVEQESVSSQSLANAIESIGRTRTEATAGRLRWEDGEPGQAAHHLEALHASSDGGVD